LKFPSKKMLQALENGVHTTAQEGLHEVGTPPSHRTSEQHVAVNVSATSASQLVQDLSAVSSTCKPLVSHDNPSNPNGHWQVKPVAAVSTQMPCAHGLLAQEAGCRGGLPQAYLRLARMGNQHANLLQLILSIDALNREPFSAHKIIRD
jgi:hypothetical protein